MKIKRIISSFLAVLMLMGSFTLVLSAEEASTEVQYEYNTTNAIPTIDYMSGQSVVPGEDAKGNTKYNPSGQKVIYTSDDKLESMDLRFEKDGYQLYVDEYSGEVATRCIATGEVLFSNPYNVGNSTAEDSIKKQIMSQLVINFIDVATNQSITYYSYEWAASRGQISVRNIKNGIRVEYTIGREEARMLVPRQIEKVAFETKIQSLVKEAAQGDAYISFLYTKLMAYYELMDPALAETAAKKQSMTTKYPITKKMPIYVFATDASQVEISTVEQIIKNYCPDYTYEEMDKDHSLVEYENTDKTPPLFKMALEYSLDEHGMTVRLPANGIRFNQSLYQLESIEILPYMGAGANSNNESSAFVNNSGYNFFPDGSGAIFDFEKITDIGVTTTIRGKVYGQDYAYHTISGTSEEILRYPVFGIVQTEDVALLQKKEQDTENGTATENEEEQVIEPDYRTHGFVAIVEEGDSLMELASYHAVRESEYNAVKMTVYPRPKDSYNIADAISVANNSMTTVVSERKYTGNYKIRYIMLTDDAVAAEKGIADYYDCTYMGMAKAYRGYLESSGILTRLEDEDIGEDIPLYIETFGALKTTEKFLSIPIDVMTPLTTFDDIKTMYDDLSSEGVENINFVMTGYTKGGLTDRQVPYKLKWDGAVSDKMDFEDLVAYARENDFSVYPDFDFAYVQGDGMFDGLSLKKHAVKTIDNRYTSKREYSSTKQAHMGFFELAISPAYFSHFYEKLTKNYLKYDPMGISVSTLGSALNSDFDEDEPYNREDSKNFTVQAFEYLADNYDKVLTSGGNAYTWKYVDYITDIALDSSRYSQAYASVPFLGLVLHGYVEITGTPINMEGNIDYAMLKAIENGASLKFILSYRNTNNLKEYQDLSKYYSVRYDIWFDDVVSLYSEINEVLSGVQTSVITEHKFVEGVRVPDDDELIGAAQSAIDAAISGDKSYEDALTQAQKDAVRNASEQIEKLVASINSDLDQNGRYTKALKSFQDAMNGITDVSEGSLQYEINATKQVLDDLKQGYATIDEKIAAIDEKIDELDEKIKTLNRELRAIDDKNSQAYKDKEAELNAAKAELNAAKDERDAHRTKKNDHVSACEDYAKLLSKAAENASKLLDLAVSISNNIALVKGEYYDIIVDEKCTLPESKKAYLKGLVDNLDIDLIYQNNDVAEYISTVITEINTARNDVSALLSTFEGDGKHLTAGQVTSKIIGEYVYEMTPHVIEKQEVKAPDKAETPTYSSDENKVVYEAYENGTIFLLNFNNYKVVVDGIVVDGVARSYTIDAYGYVVLKRAN